MYLAYSLLTFVAFVLVSPYFLYQAVRYKKYVGSLSQRLGYLPITLAAFKLTEQSGFYKQNPGTETAVNQMIRKTTDKSRGVRLGNFVQIRTIIDEELEGVWSGKKAPKEALDMAIQRGNEQLERFQKANKG